MKQIIFKNLKIKNFLSIAEEELQLQFNSGINLITGENKDTGGRNGIGKSSIIESIYWALFGSTIREIKNERIVHNNSKKNKCEVALELSVTKQTSEDDVYNYKIVRSLNPSKLYILENGIDITLSSIQKTDELIKQIIGANEQVFQNAVIMTANNTIPFMAQKKIEKRKFIEGIFNIGIFGDLLLKIRSDYNEKKKAHDILTSSFISEQKNIAFCNQQKHKNDRDKQIQIEKIQAEIKNIDSKIEELSDHKSIASTLAEASTKQKELVSMIEKIKKGINKVEDSINSQLKVSLESDFNLKTLTAEFDFYKKQEGSCPTCKRKYDSKNLICEDDKKTLELKLKGEQENNKIFKDTIKDLISKKTLLKGSLKQKEHEFDSNEICIKNINKDIKQIDEIRSKKDQLLESVNFIKTQKDSLDDVIKNSEKTISIYEKDLKTIQKDLLILNNCKFVVSEEGVKTYIIKKMLKIFNQQLNFYLKSLDAPCTCNFDEMFEETIYNLKGDECSYFNFSGGERRRIDIAILFMFQDILRSQTGVSFNISIYDELFDSAIDEKGMHKIFEMLTERSQKYLECIYIVSHNKSASSLNYESIVQLQKSNGITTIIPSI